MAQKKTNKSGTQLTRFHNPGGATFPLPEDRRKNMPVARKANKKRRSGSRRRRRNTTTTATSQRRANTSTSARLPNKRRSTRRRRRNTGVRRYGNPRISNLIEQAGYATLGAIATTWLAAMIPGGPVSPWLEVGKKLGVAWLLGMGAGKYLKGEKGNHIAVGGAIVAVTEAVGILIPSINKRLIQIVPVSQGALPAGDLSGYDFGLGDYAAGMGEVPAFEQYAEGAY